ncbi:MAG: phytanoyl-CoA dioxygenase family protein [Dermatophilaceae bacterium]
MPAAPLSSPYAVSPDDVAAYRRDGHIVLRGVASAGEVTAYGPAIRAAVSANNTERRPLAERDLYSQAFLQTMNLWQVDEYVAEFVLSQRFASIAAQLLGVERVRLYHDQALFKEPGGAFTPWHQDAGYWPLRGERCITMWLPLMAVQPAMGTLQFASGTNAAGSLSDEVISQASEDHFMSLVADGLLDGRFPVTEPATLALGDASFHGGWTLHRALPNDGAETRAVMTVIWFADGERVIDRPGEHAAGDLATWLPGCAPGDLARSPLSPILPRQEQASVGA